MVATNVSDLNIIELGNLLKSKRVCPVELTEAYLDQIEALNPVINAFITIARSEALEQANAAKREIAAGNYRGPLHGVPIAVKDIFETKELLTTCGSKILKNNVTRYDATAVARLRRSGCIVLGKTSMPEFAMGNDVNPLTGAGPTRNPWDLKRSTSGSSSGSAAAVSASLCAGALGTDSGGSIRLPAGYCGIVGMKPTYGRVSRRGVTPLAWSLDTVGPMTRSVEDNALMLSVIAGADPNDRTCVARPVPDYRKDLRTGVKGLRIGLPRGYFLDYATRDVTESIYEAVRTLERCGATLLDVDLPHTKYALGAEIAIMSSEALAYHSKYIRHGQFEMYTASTQAQLDAARFISASDYVQAQRVRRLIIRDFESAYAHVDVIVAPSTGMEANLIQEDDWIDQAPTRQVTAGNITLLEILSRMPAPANLAGVPALALPCGFSADGLPLGLQIMGRHWEEATVYRAGAALEQATAWHTRRPVISVTSK